MNMKLFFKLIVLVLLLDEIQSLRFRSQATGRYLTSNYRGEIFSRRGYFGLYRKWSLEPIGDGWMFIRNRRTGLYLEAGSQNSHFVYSTPIKDNDFQKWKFDGLKIVNKATFKLLDSDRRGRVYITSYNGGPFQNWLQFY